jgi:hypothetical protein
MLSLTPATDTQIADAEHQLGMCFSYEYKMYLKHFGAIIADGIELSGIAKSKHRNVVTVTIQERKFNSKVPDNLYVIENTDIDGIVIWQDPNGTIYKTEPNKGPKKIADSLTVYIKNHK